MRRSSSRINSRRRKGNGWVGEASVVQVIHGEKRSCQKENGNGERGRGVARCFRGMNNARGGCLRGDHRGGRSLEEE